MPDILSLQILSAGGGNLPVIYTILVSFLLSSVIGVTYIKTFRGLSYSRTYIQAVILGSMVAATVIHAIGDSLARGLGMMGALAIIRFRSSFKDPRDIMFLFASLAAGIGCGVGAFSTAVTGTAGFVMTAFLLHVTPLGQSSAFDGMLRFNVASNDEDRGEVESLLKKHCRCFVLITLRDMQQGERIDCAYHIKLKKSGNAAELIRDFSEKVASVRGIGLMLQETTVEL